MGTTILIVWAVWLLAWFCLSDRVIRARREEREDGSFFHTSEVEEVQQ